MILLGDYRVRYLHEFCDRRNLITERRGNGYRAGATLCVDRPSLPLAAYSGDEVAYYHHYAS